MQQHFGKILGGRHAKGQVRAFGGSTKRRLQALASEDPALSEE